MSSASDKVKRLLFLVPYVAAHRGEGVPLDELAALLGTTRGELLAEIDLACRVGPPLGDPGEFVLMAVEDGRVFADLPQRFTRPPRLTTYEAFALLLGAQALKDSEIQPYEEAIGRAQRKLRKALAEADGELLAELESAIHITTDTKKGIVPELLRAARRRNAVTIDYYSAGSRRRRRRGVDPYGLINNKGAWYLVGRCHINDEARIFKCERISAVDPLGERFEVPAGFDLDRFGKDKLKLPAGRRGQVRLRFRGEAARSAVHWPGAKKGTDGTVEVHVAVSASERLVSWVLRWGGDCEVLAPDSLAEAVAERFRTVVDLHS